jgi:cytochrome c biogenesis protein CcmG, thiol:disulfide interchange protein DsbE
LTRATREIAGELRFRLRCGSARGSTVVAMAILAFLAIALIGYLWLPSRQAPAPPAPSSPPIPDYASQPGVGKRLPRLDLEPLTGEGQPVTLEKLAGHVVVVNFWGAWCPPCRLEFPELAKLYAELGANPRFRLLAVSCGQGGPEDPKELWQDTRAFLAGSGYEMPTYSDPNETTRRAFDRVAGLQAFPTTFVMDGDGLIRGVWTGYRRGVGREIKDLVERLLQGGGTAGPKTI